LVVALTEAIAQEIESNLHISRPKIRVVPGTVHPCFFERATEEEVRAMRGRFNLTGSYYLCVSGSRQSKNLNSLLEIATPAIPVVLALQWEQIAHGQGYDLAAWKTAQESGAFRFLGTVEDFWLRALYAKAEGLIIPSFYEGFSLAAVEGLACSCLPVLSDIPSHRNLFGDTRGLEALFFDPKVQGDLRAATERVRIAGNSLKTVVLEKFRELCHRYAVNDVADRMQQVYREAAEL